MAWQKQGQSAITWTTESAITVRWQDEGELPGARPSVASRLNPVIAQAPAPFRNPNDTFTHRIRTEFPFFIASGNLAVITSGFTQGAL